MTTNQAIYAILFTATVLVGCQHEASAPAAAPARAENDGEDKVRVQLNLGKQGSIDIEKKE